MTKRNKVTTNYLCSTGWTKAEYADCNPAIVTARSKNLLYSSSVPKRYDNLAMAL